jgi:hypothetical protein
MSFSISKSQQKIFIEQFINQVLDVSLQMVEEGNDKNSPGETIYAVGRAVIRQLYNFDGTKGDGGRDDAN